MIIFCLPCAVYSRGNVACGLLGGGYNDLGLIRHDRNGLLSIFVEGGGAFEDEVGAKILGTNLIVGGKGLRSSALEDVAFIQEVGAVDDGEGFTHIVVGDDYADILVFELSYDVLDVLDGSRVDSSKRFIEKDELRVYGKGTGDLKATLDTVRQ